jgi:hypothetical protein
LLKREDSRQRSGKVSRIEKGDAELLLRVREMSRVLPMKLTVFIVQPGLSVTRVSTDQLQLLSVTQNHLRETFEIPLGVIASA